MLAEFIEQHHDEIVARTRSRIASRITPRPTEHELKYGVPLFLDQLRARLSSGQHGTTQIAATATLHGSELLESGVTIGQVVHDYGDICQAITEVALERSTAFSTEDFRLLNLCLDIAIAEAVSEYSRRRELAIAGINAEHLGVLAHELRNLLNTATLGFEAVRTGSVGPTGSTGAIIEKCLFAMSDLISRSLAAVRLQNATTCRDRVPLAHVLEEIEISSILGARRRKIAITVERPEPGIAVAGDAQILTSVLNNLIQNACKFTPEHGHVAIRTRVTAERVAIDVADECGGLPPGKQAELFQPFVQRSQDRTGVGLGLSICLQGARAMGGELSVRDLPGRGCVFTVDLRRAD